MAKEKGKLEMNTKQNSLGMYMKVVDLFKTITQRFANKRVFIDRNCPGNLFI